MSGCWRPTSPCMNGSSWPRCKKNVDGRLKMWIWLNIVSFTSNRFYQQHHDWWLRTWVSKCVKANAESMCMKPAEANTCCLNFHSEMVWVAVTNADLLKLFFQLQTWIPPELVQLWGWECTEQKDLQNLLENNIKQLSFCHVHIEIQQKMHW